MLDIKVITNNVIQEFLLNDPILCQMGLCDEALNEIQTKGTYTSLAPTLLGVYRSDELICCILAYLITNITCEWHILMSTKIHGKGISKEIQETLAEYLKQYDVKMMTTAVPKVCDYMHTTLLARGWKLTGIVPNGIKWRGVVQDNYLYHKEI